MKISLSLNLDQALKKSAGVEKTIKKLYSFIDYCENQEFTYPVTPRTGEFISLEELFTEWVKLHDNSGLHMFENMDLITTCIGKVIKVVNVVHHVNRSVLYCSDLYKLE